MSRTGPIDAFVPVITLDLFGVGLASAVLLDALIVRRIVTPASMLVIGERRWSLPRGSTVWCPPQRRGRRPPTGMPPASA